MTTLDDLRRAVIAQKTVTLPFEPPDPSLEALHNSVAGYDALVSSLVFQALSGSRVRIDHEGMRAARGQVEQAVEETSAGNREVEVYLRYLKRLDAVYDLVQALNKEGGDE